MISKKICIFFFSGTGNTKLISQLLYKEFVRHSVKAEIVDIEDIDYKYPYSKVNFASSDHSDLSLYIKP